MIEFFMQIMQNFSQNFISIIDVQKKMNGCYECLLIESVLVISDSFIESKFTTNKSTL